MNAMENIGLHTYHQNFTVHVPFPGVSEPRTLTGMNVYGILRAPRIAGTEAVVISVPYNQGNNKGALALMLAFADHCRSKFRPGLVTFGFGLSSLLLNFSHQPFMSVILT